MAEKANQMFAWMEKLVAEQKSIVLGDIGRSQQKCAAKLIETQKILEENSTDILKFREDIETNIENIIQEMDTCPFNEILKQYMARLDEFSLYNKHISTLEFQTPSLAIDAEVQDALRQKFLPNLVQV